MSSILFYQYRYFSKDLPQSDADGGVIWLQAARDASVTRDVRCPWKIDQVSVLARLLYGRFDETRSAWPVRSAISASVAAAGDGFTTFRVLPLSHTS